MLLPNFSSTANPTIYCQDCHAVCCRSNRILDSPSLDYRVLGGGGRGRSRNLSGASNISNTSVQTQPRYSHLHTTHSPAAIPTRYLLTGQGPGWQGEEQGQERGEEESLQVPQQEQVGDGTTASGPV